MLKVSNIDVVGFAPAIRGMRNPMNSWDKSDSISDCFDTYMLGENDMKLMKSLFKGGTEHRKYARMIQVYMDIEAPLYWWKEFDTYKVGTVCNSCSTMHKIQAKEFTFDDFSHEHLDEEWICVDTLGYTDEPRMSSRCLMELTIEILNYYRERFNNFKDKDDWWQMIQLLPSSYNQKRTVMINYETVFNIIRQRKNHKLTEWHTLVDELLNLPYVEEIMDNGSEEKIY